MLDKVAAAANTELNDDAALRDQLLAAQMRVEVGEMSQDDFEVLEAEILARLREIREQRQGSSAGLSPKDYKITGIEATFEGDEHSTTR